MRKHVVIIKKGDVCGVHSAFYVNDNEDVDNKFIEILKSKSNVVGHEEDTTKDPSEVEFYYIPTMYKQRLYRHLPFKVSESVEIIDAFACSGRRFGLTDIMVFVEIRKSSMGDSRIFAFVYYACDSEIPSLIIETASHIDFGF